MTRPWYRRFPDNFIAGTAGLTLEEKGAYSLVLDLIYVRGGPIPDEPRYIAGVCNCSVRKWTAIRARLIETKKIVVVDGHLTNARAEKELENAAKDARELAENGAKGGNKTAEKQRAASKNKHLGAAPVQHARATLNQYQDSILKKINPILKERPIETSVDGKVRLHSDDPLFRQIAAMRGKHPPTDQNGYWTFAPDVVEQARAALAATPTSEGLH